MGGQCSLICLEKATLTWKTMKLKQNRKGRESISQLRKREQYFIPVYDISLPFPSHEPKSPLFIKLLWVRLLYMQLKESWWWRTGTRSGVLYDTELKMWTWQEVWKAVINIHGLQLLAHMDFQVLPWPWSLSLYLSSHILFIFSVCLPGGYRLESFAFHDGKMFMQYSLHLSL